MRWSVEEVHGLRRCRGARPGPRPPRTTWQHRIEVNFRDEEIAPTEMEASRNSPMAPLRLGGRLWAGVWGVGILSRALLDADRRGSPVGILVWRGPGPDRTKRRSATPRASARGSAALAMWQTRDFVL